MLEIEFETAVKQPDTYCLKDAPIGQLVRFRPKELNLEIYYYRVDREFHLRIDKEDGLRVENTSKMNTYSQVALTSDKVNIKF